MHVQSSSSSSINLLHVTATGRGILYTSDSVGEYYTVSLLNHLVSVGLFTQSVITYTYIYYYLVCEKLFECST